jgi:hypothetical protein
MKLRTSGAGRTLFLATLLSLSIVACGGNTVSETSSSESTVLTNPALPKTLAKISGIILQDSENIQTLEEFYDLRGELILQADGELPIINWKVLNGSTTKTSGSFTPTAKQFSLQIPVSVADNVIQIYADDGSPNPLIFSKQVTRNTAPLLKGSLELSRNLVFTSESTSVIARIAIDSSLTTGLSVKLVELSASGAETSVATMVDTGVLGQGDEVQGDGIYSAQFSVISTSETVKAYRAVVTASSTAFGVTKSVQRDIRVTTRLPDTALNSILSAQKAATNRLTTARASGLPSLKQAVQTELSLLRANPDVQIATTNDAGTAISVVYKSGIAGIIGKPDAGIKGGADLEKGEASLVATNLTSSRSIRPQNYTKPSNGLTLPHLQTYKSFEDGCPQASTSNLKQTNGSAKEKSVGVATKPIGSNRVFALAANYSQWGENDDIPQLAATLEKNDCLDVSYKRTAKDGEGSVEDFKDLGQYGMILISSHGDTHYSLLGSDTFSAMSTISKTFGWTPASAQVVIYSNMLVTTANKSTYEADLKAGRLVIWGDVYGVMPTFIRTYAGQMSDSVVYMSICRGSWNNTMADAFIARGAKAYIGYSDYVSVPFTISSSKTLFTEFLKASNTLGDAFALVSPKIESAPDPDPAEFRLIGTSDVSVGAGLRNGDFESGSLGAWTQTGDGRIVSQLGGALPTGKYMAIISTGLGYTTTAGSISQVLCLGTETQLTYRWNFQSEEFLEYVGSQFQDAFVVTLTEIANPTNKVQIQSSTIDSLASNVSAVSNSFDQGGVFETGWRTTSFTIPLALKGKRVRLSFSVTDVGDSSYDTAVLLDEIKLK